jgi:hypothetical protein
MPVELLLVELKEEPSIASRFSLISLETLIALIIYYVGSIERFISSTGLFIRLLFLYLGLGLIHSFVFIISLSYSFLSFSIFCHPLGIFILGLATIYAGTTSLSSFLMSILSTLLRNLSTTPKPSFTLRLPTKPTIRIILDAYSSDT